MKGRCVRLLLLSCFSIASLAQPQAAPTLSADEFVQELARLRARVQELESKPQSGPELEAGLPKVWKVRTAQADIEVPTEYVRSEVESFLKAPPAAKAGRRKELENSLSLLASEAEQYQHAEALPAGVHARLDRILEAREFRGLRGPSPLQLLWQRLLSWLQAQADKYYPNLPSATEAGPIFAWCVIALVCSGFAVWLYRRSRESELQLLHELMPSGPGDKGWRGWLAEARACAERGEFRDAIHLAFWAAVAKLEAEGAWTPDSTRTPREYLRAIPEWNTARPAFQSIMRSFERAWYGQFPASAEDFQKVLTALDTMECR